MSLRRSLATRDINDSVALGKVLSQMVRQPQADRLRAALAAWNARQGAAPLATLADVGMDFDALCRARKTR